MTRNNLHVLMQLTHVTQTHWTHKPHNCNQLSTLVTNLFVDSLKKRIGIYESSESW